MRRARIVVRPVAVPAGDAHVTHAMHAARRRGCPRRLAFASPASPTTGRSRRRRSRCRRTRRSAARRSRTCRSATRPTASSTRRATTRSSSRISSPARRTPPASTSRPTRRRATGTRSSAAGRPIDTDKYFVVSADALDNLNTKDPNVVTTGPATINPDTGKPYGMSFPGRLATATRCACTRRCVDSLGVKKLQAVAGASGGSIQAMEWAALYPGLRRARRARDRAGLRHPCRTSIEMLDVWATPIRIDPKWNNGDYYGARRAARRRRQRAQDHHDHRRARSAGPRRPSATSGPTRRRIRPTRWTTRSRSRTRSQGGRRRAPRRPTRNSMIYTAKANQLYRLTDDEVKGMKAKILFVPAASDEIFPPELSRARGRALPGAGRRRGSRRSSTATAGISTACSTSRSRARRSARSWREVRAARPRAAALRAGELR